MLQGGRGDEQSSILIQQRERIAQRPAPGLHPLGLHRCAVNLVHPPLGLRPMQPHQPIEKIMQVIPRGHLGALQNELLISHARGQICLRHKAHPRIGGCALRYQVIEGLRHRGTSKHLLRRSLSQCRIAL